MNVLSLFDGIATGRLALERVGIKVDKYYASEIEPSAMKVATKNYPDIIELGDVNNWQEWNIDWASIDLLIGGSPCQSLSIIQSKTRENLDGKSKLFFVYVDILNHVLKANPSIKFLFENVASMNQESKEAIESCLGVPLAYQNSDAFSAQERPRYYGTNFDWKPIDKPNDTVLRDIILDADKVPDKYWYKEPVFNIDMEQQICGQLQINIHDMHKRVFNPAFKCHTLTCVSGGNQQKKVLQNGRARKLMPVEYERLQTLPDNYTKGLCDTKRWTCIGNGWTADVVAYILSFLKEKEN